MSRPFTFDRVARIMFTIAIVFAVLWLINILKDVLLPFLVACLIAYMLEPVVQHNRRLLHLKGRTTAIFVTLFELLFFLGVICYFLVPMIMDEMSHMAAVFRAYAASSEGSVSFLPDGIQDFLRRQIDFTKLSEMLTVQDLTTILESVMDTLWSIISSGIGMIAAIISWCIVALYVVFIMLDYERLNNGFKHLFPKPYRQKALRIGNDIKDSMNQYFRGQALVAAIVGVLFAIGFSIIGLPMAIVLGLFIGLLNMVPYLQLISFVPTILLCLVSSVGEGISFWSLFWQCMAVYLIVQAIQDLVLTPKIMGKAMGLNPALILLSLSVWGTLLGFIGLIIALPLTTLLLSYYNRYIIHGHRNREAVEAAEKS